MGSVRGRELDLEGLEMGALARRDEGEEVRREAAGEVGGFEGCGEGEEEGGGYDVCVLFLHLDV